MSLSRKITVRARRLKAGYIDVLYLNLKALYLSIELQKKEHNNNKYKKKKNIRNLIVYKMLSWLRELEFILEILCLVMIPAFCRFYIFTDSVLFLPFTKALYKI